MSKRQSIAAGIARALNVFGGSFRDLTVLAGAGLVAYGAWLYSHPLGFVSGGTLLIAGAVAQEIASLPPTSAKNP